jgi:hypothetical protein
VWPSVVQSPVTPVPIAQKRDSNPDTNPMTDKPDGKGWFFAARTGAFIGLVGGLLTGPMIFAWLIIDCFLEHDTAQGGRLVIVPFLYAASLTVVGACLGAVAGAISGANGVRIGNVGASTLFGMYLLGIIGTLWALLIYVSETGVHISAAKIIGTLLVAPLLAGAAGGALVGKRPDEPATQLAPIRDAMSDEPRFPWRKLGMALALLPLSLAMWAIGLESAFSPHPNLIQGLLFVGSPLVVIAGAIWTLVIVARHFWPRRPV